MAHKVILPPKKNYIKKFLKQRDIGIFIYQSAVVYCCCVLLSVVGCSCVLLFVVASYELYVRRWGGGELLLGLFLPPPPHHYSQVYMGACCWGGGG